MPKVSVILPIYNVDKFLEECLNSLLDQTLDDIEIICVNDGSTDNSLNIIKMYSEKNDKVIMLNQKNKGVSAARNLGLSIACGDYITFVDPDDFLVKGGLEALYKKAMATGADIVHGFFSICDENGSNIRNWWNNSGYRPLVNNLYSGHDFLNYLFDMELSACNGIYKKSFISSLGILFPENITCSEDMVWTYSHHIYAKKITAVDLQYYIYRLQNKSQTHQRKKSNVTIINAISLFEKKYLPKNLDKSVWKRWEARKTILLKWAVKELIPFNELIRFNLTILKEFPVFFMTIFIGFIFSKFLKVVKINIRKLLYKIWFFKKIKWIEQRIEENEKVLSQRINIIEQDKRVLNQRINVIEQDKRVLNQRINIIEQNEKVLREQNRKFDNIINKLDWLVKLIRENFIFFIQNEQYIARINNPIYFDELILKKNDLRIIGNLDKWAIENRNSFLPILFNSNKFSTLENAADIIPEADIAYLWGFWDFYKVLTMLSISNKIPFIYIEDGFLKSVLTAPIEGDTHYHSGIGFTIDDLTFYFDATRPSRLELMINSDDVIISENQKKRARNLIDIIINNHLTKYNHQPIYPIEIGRKNAKKVLIVDQTVGDYSITKGLANDDTFKEMLKCAIKENPDADVIVKTHPDTIAKNDNTSGYYSKLESNNNIYVVKTNINPISLLKCVDSVYVCTSQLGFEALMCGKEVHVFGMPFYAGWGLTKDRQFCARRYKKRTLEEIFYIVYILYSKYVNPKTKSHCEIEDAIDYLLEIRNEYFQKYNIRIER